MSGDMLPDHLGDVIGDTDGPTYYRIEVHYENPQGKNCKGMTATFTLESCSRYKLIIFLVVIDSSGIRIFYTPVLREYETAVLFSGHRRTPFLTIPPHQKHYTTYGFCGAECTQKVDKDMTIKCYLNHACNTSPSKNRLSQKHIRLLSFSLGSPQRRHQNHFCSTSRPLNRTENSFTSYTQWKRAATNSSRQSS